MNTNKAVSLRQYRAIARQFERETRVPRDTRDARNAVRELCGAREYRAIMSEYE